MSLNKGISGSNIIKGGVGAPRLDNINEKKRRRKPVLPGFPKKEKFKNLSEINEYFSGDRIQCLLCGNWYKIIGGGHLKTHNVSGDDYKEMFGLPFNRGLASENTHKKCSTTQKKLYKTGVNPLARKEIRDLGCREAKKITTTEKYRLQPFNKKRMGETHKYSSVSQYITPKSEIIKVIERVGNGELLSYVLKDKDTISKFTFFRYLKVYGLRSELDKAQRKRKQNGGGRCG